VVGGAESEAEITPCHRSYIVVDPYTLNTVCVRFARFHSSVEKIVPAFLNSGHEHEFG
jgi:hypothetical protein